MNNFKLLLDLEKQAAAQTGSKGPLRTLTDTLWNVGKGAIKGTWDTATAIPRAAWNGVHGMIGSVYSGAANSDGTLGGAIQGGFDSAWNHGASSAKQFGSDVTSPFRQLNNIFNRPNAGPKYGTSPAQTPTVPPQPAQPAQPPLNPMQSVAQQYPQVYSPDLVKSHSVKAALSKAAQDLPGPDGYPQPQSTRFPGIQPPGAIAGGQPTGPGYFANLGNAIADPARSLGNIGGAFMGTKTMPEPPPIAGGPVPGSEINIPGGQVGFAKALDHAKNYQPPTQPQATQGPTAEQIAAFQRGTASKFNAKSKMDQWKMQQLMAGKSNWASNPLYWAQASKQASVQSLMQEIPRDVYLEFLAEAFA